MCSHGNLATTARSPLGAPRSLQRTIQQIAREHTVVPDYTYTTPSDRGSRSSYEFWYFAAMRLRYVTFVPNHRIRRITIPDDTRHSIP